MGLKLSQWLSDASMRRERAEYSEWPSLRIGSPSEIGPVTMWSQPPSCSRCGSKARGRHNALEPWDSSALSHGAWSTTQIFIDGFYYYYWTLVLLAPAVGSPQGNSNMPGVGSRLWLIPWRKPGSDPGFAKINLALTFY